MKIFPDHTLAGEGFISTKEEMQPQPTTLLKLYAMFHNVLVTMVSICKTAEK